MFVCNIVLIASAISPAVSSAVRNLASISTCRSYQWQCTDSTCIVVDGKCDGKVDCPDRSDETYALCGNIEPTVSGKCELPPYPEHGTYVETNHPSATPGQIFKYTQLNITCEQGYGVLGDVMPYCLEGKWYKYDPIPKCVPFCRLDPDVSVHFNCQVPGTNSYRICNQSEPSGTLVKPECNAPNYGSKDALLSMTCQSNGKWNRIIKCRPECGRVTPDAEGLIWGGTEAVRGELPWHVAIYEKPTQKRNHHQQICGGSLVSNGIVISAAHCFGDRGKSEKPPASKYAVATGKLFREWNHKDDKDAQKSELKSIELSPYYQGIRTNFQHDIAGLILETPFVYDINVRPVCLDFDKYFNRRQLQVGNFGKVAGWGLTEENGPYSPILKVVKLPFVSIDECLRITPPTFTESITADKICAGYNNGTAAICKGDSGGGLSFPETKHGTTRYYLRGIVSTAPRVSEECNVFTVTTFTEIYQHKDFINQLMSPKCTLPPYPEYGVYEAVWDPAAKPGDEAEYVYLNVSCNHGHSIIGNNVVVCAQGEWFTTMPECVPVCYLEEHPSVTYSCNKPGAEGFGPCGQHEPVGTSVKSKCGPGYFSPAVMPWMRCVDGAWDYVAQCTPDCGRLSNNATTLPWYVYINLQYSDSNPENFKQICGGSIISPNIVISGALCFVHISIFKTSSYYVVVNNGMGAIRNEEKFPIKDVKVADQFPNDENYYQEDIALVILSQAFTYSLKLYPVCLDFDYSFNKKQLLEGSLDTVGAFSFNSVEVTMEQSLRFQRIPYIPVRKCIEMTAGPFDNKSIITEDKICAGGKNGTLICDSSSALAFPEHRRGVVRYYLRGVACLKSWFLQLTPRLDSILLADVYHHKDFIKEHLATSLPPRVIEWQETEDPL